MYSYKGGLVFVYGLLMVHDVFVSVFFPLALFFVVLNSLGSFLWFSKIMSHLLDHQKVLKIVGHVSMIIFGLAFCTAF